MKTIELTEEEIGNLNNGDRVYLVDRITKEYIKC